MPYKYIGRSISHKGKTLWEIVGNLRNYGVGRIVVRNTFQRYPEPCFYRILKVEALPNPENPSMDARRRVKVWVEETFRGRFYPEHDIISVASYKADYKLIPKDEEYKYQTIKEKTLKIMPKYIELPPILKELIIRENISNGDPPEKDNKAEVLYVKGPFANFRAAEEGEKPDVETTMALGVPASPSLYANVNLELNNVKN